MLMDHGTPWWKWQSFSGQAHLSLGRMRQGLKLSSSGIRHPQTQGKVERFHGSLRRALDPRGDAGDQPQAWLDAYREEHNQVRPQEAPKMQTPATLWHPSPRRCNPTRPKDLPRRRMDAQDPLSRRYRHPGKTMGIGKTLAGERVLIQPVKQRFLTCHCYPPVREIGGCAAV